MKILGLDLSLRSTGYVLLDDDQVAWRGAVGFPELREGQRLQAFWTWIHPALQQRLVPRGTSGGRLDHVAIEGYSYASANGLAQAGELGGVIKLAVHQAGIPCQMIAPGTWKRVLCGNGHLDKKNAAVEIFKRYGVEYHLQDTLDAWAVAMCLRRQLLGLDKPEPKSRKHKDVPPLIPAMEAANDEASSPAGLR